MAINWLNSSCYMGMLSMNGNVAISQMGSYLYTYFHLLENAAILVLIWIASLKLQKWGERRGVCLHHQYAFHNVSTIVKCIIDKPCINS